MTARIQDKGLDRVTAALAALSFWFQWGTGSAAAKTANAVTTTGTTEARSSTTNSQTNGAVTKDTLTLIGTITALAARTITELGAFDAAGTGNPATGGNMDFYADFASLGLGTGDSVQFTMNVTLA